MFEVIDPETDELLLRTVVRYDCFFIVGTPVRPDSSYMTDPPELISEGVEETLSHEFNRSKQVIRTFTRFGFDKGRLPEDIYGSMLTYLYNNRHSRYIEDWPVRREKRGINGME
jgi:hypothetical protein